MEHTIYVGTVSRTHASFLKKPEAKTDKPKGFKEQIAEMAKYKSPKEMTLEEYRQYLKEKINKTVLPLCGGIEVSVEFSDMALVLMKCDPELEEMVLKGLWHELRKEGKIRKKERPVINVQIFDTRENKAEEKEALKRRMLRKKKLELYFEKRAEQRKNYTEFLETGRRYATPCPATELLKIMQSMGSFLGI